MTRAAAAVIAVLVCAGVARADDPPSADDLFVAARDCEEHRADPACALRLYERILAEFPDARAAVASKKRADALRAELGAHGEHAAEAAALAQLIADADRLAPRDVEARAAALTATAWPGAATAALWYARWLRRHGRFTDALAQLAAARARFPAVADAAAREAAGTAIDARDWAAAEAAARALPAADAERADLLATTARGRQADRWYVEAWLALAAALALLTASLLDAALRGGWRRPRARPPIEVIVLGPLALAFAGYAWADGAPSAPVVATIALGGAALAWLSGAALDLLRLRGRSVRLRSVVHVLACLAGVAALAYVAVYRAHLIDL